MCWKFIAKALCPTAARQRTGFSAIRPEFVLLSCRLETGHLLCHWSVVVQCANWLTRRHFSLETHTRSTSWKLLTLDSVVPKVWLGSCRVRWASWARVSFRVVAPFQCLPKVHYSFPLDFVRCANAFSFRPPSRTAARPRRDWTLRSARTPLAVRWKEIKWDLMLWLHGETKTFAEEDEEQ